MSLEAFRTQVAEIGDLLSAAAALSWDMRTMMPAGGVESRGRQLATLAAVARERLLSDAMRRALDAAGTPEDEVDREALAQVRAAIAIHDRLPAALLRERNEVRAPAQAAWGEARARRDFGLFAPWLERTVALARAQADALGYEDHPHDALQSLFEPGETGRTLAPLFAELRAGLHPLVAAIAERPAPASLPAGPFEPAAQHAFGSGVARRLGYDFRRGRLDPTVHPFEQAITRDDVRITTRYRTDAIEVGLKATMHETGHGLYEQNVDPAHAGTALALDLVALATMGAPSLGTHESQSRLWENHVGRSRAFWALTYPELRAAFPEALSAVDPERFYRAYNRVAPGPIRVEADELTYDFHIMLRYEIERALIDGSLAVADLPEAWRAAMQRDLGVSVRDDADGVLQDIHWSLGLFGSFASYTIGNVMAAQLWAALTTADPAIVPAADAGDYGPLRAALAGAIWRHGRRYPRDTLLRRATGRGLDAGPYVGYLRDKYSALYGLAA